MNLDDDTVEVEKAAQLILSNPEGMLAAAHEIAKSKPGVLKDYGRAFFFAGRIMYESCHDLRRATYYVLKSLELDSVSSYNWVAPPEAILRPSENFLGNLSMLASISRRL